MYNFRTISGSTKFLSYKDWAIGDYVIGKIVMFKPNKLSPKFQDVQVTVLESNIDKDSVTLNPKDSFTINGTTVLENALLQGVEEGDIIRVEFLGKEANKTGAFKGKMSNRLDIKIAPAQDEAKVVSQSKASQSDDEVL